MYNVPSREEVKYLQDRYPSGTRVKLGHMNDPDAVPSGTTGSVFHVDSIGQIHVKWDNGRTLPLVIGQDSFSVCRDEVKQHSEKPKGNKISPAR